MLKSVVQSASFSFSPSVGRDSAGLQLYAQLQDENMEEFVIFYENIAVYHLDSSKMRLDRKFILISIAF